MQLLQQSLERGRLAHGYLFIGDALGVLEGVATNLAKTLNCLASPRKTEGGLALDCCDHCLNCRKIQGLNHPDVQFIRPESKSRIITIDQMRALMQTMNLKPTEAEYKVAIIVAADRLNTQAANAFLKTLEEPPARSILVLLTTEPQRILETILSRCLRLTFAGESGIQLQPAEQEWLVQFTKTATDNKGGILGRYRLLGALLGLLARTKEEVEKALTAQSPLEKYDDVDSKLREKWEDELSAAVEAEYRRRRSEAISLLQWWLRDVWLHNLAMPEFAQFPDLGEPLQKIAKRITREEAGENLRVMEQTQRHLYSNVQEALALEVGLLKLKL